MSGSSPASLAPAGPCASGRRSTPGTAGSKWKATPIVLVGADGAPIGSLAEAPDSLFNRTRTISDGWGASAQAAVRSTIGGMENIFIAGGAIDGARTRYRSGSDLGILGPDRGVESLDHRHRQ